MGSERNSGRSKLIEDRIRNDSAIVDGQFLNNPSGIFKKYSLALPVPPHHPRAKMIGETKFTVGSLEEYTFPNGSYYLVDSALRDMPKVSTLGIKAHFVKADESTLKEISWLNRFVDGEIFPVSPTIVGIGGGILLNAAAYIAEKKGTDFISVPTSVLAAADSAIGGLVRINEIDESGEFHKSFYKSVYEPSRIILDPRFLAALPESQISFGLSEVVKHGVYQSPALLEYLTSDDFDPFSDRAALLKVICWVVALKNVDIIHDPDSESFGGDILRGGHKLALSIEEESQFQVPHGVAVAIGVYQDVAHDLKRSILLDKIYQKLHLPKAKTDLSVKP